MTGNHGTHENGPASAAEPQPSLDDLVGPGEDQGGIVRPSDLAVLRFIISSNLVGLDRQVIRFRAFEDFVHIDRALPNDIANIRAVGHERS
jgi:hypothetical protein